MIHMKCQDLFFSEKKKKKKKKFECCLLQILLGALRVNIKIGFIDRIVLLSNEKMVYIVQ